jgi:diguanylate cyclase (GGDEF)-like protein
MTFLLVFLCVILTIILVLFVILYIRSAQKEKIDSACINILFAQAGKAIFYFDAEKQAIIPTKSFAIVFGQKISAALNVYNDFSQIIYSEDAESYRKMIQSVCSGNNITDFRFRIAMDDSKEIWCSLSTTAIESRYGKHIIIGSIGNIDKQIRDEDQLRFKAERDPLTGLYNKVTTEMLITSTLLDRKYKNTVNAFLMIDIDNLKQMNDKLGHIAGDKIISRLADCIRMTFRESDILGRIGGDEFVVFMKDITSKENAYKKAQKLCRLYTTIIEQNNRRIELSCSIGISFYSEHGTTFNALYSCADKAMYTAKDSGKNQCIPYVDDLCAERA